MKSFRSRSAIEGARILRRYIVQCGIHVVHAFDVSANLFCVPLGRMFGVPVLASQLCYCELFPRHIQWLTPAIDRLAAGIFVNCEGLAAHLNVDWGVSRDVSMSAGTVIRLMSSILRGASVRENLQMPASLSIRWPFYDLKRTWECWSNHL